MNSTFLELFREAPSTTSLLASSLPMIPEWPFIHSKDVQPALFWRMFIMGQRRFAWEMFTKSEPLISGRLSHRDLITQVESVLIWRLLVLGVACVAL